MVQCNLQEVEKQNLNLWIVYRGFQKERYDFESVYTFLQRT
jgi:hypothetical protein